MTFKESGICIHGARRSLCPWCEVPNEFDAECECGGHPVDDDGLCSACAKEARLELRRLNARQAKRQVRAIEEANRRDS